MPIKGAIYDDFRVFRSAICFGFSGVLQRVILKIISSFSKSAFGYFLSKNFLQCLYVAFLFAKTDGGGILYAFISTLSSKLEKSFSFDFSVGSNVVSKTRWPSVVRL